MNMPRLLIVDDEATYRDTLASAFQREGFEVMTASDGNTALECFASFQPDVVLLDVMLPGRSGVDVCRELRVQSNVPIIMLSARAGEIDAVVGLEVGADDYVAKPFRLRELIARVRAAIRRVPRETPAVELSDDVIEIGNMRVDVARHEATRNGEVLSLARKEFHLLETLMRHAGRVLPRDVLLRTVGGNDFFGDTKTLDVHVKRLRAKIEDDPNHPIHIVTVRGVGYRYEP